jgi:two-component system sensor histidine kinase KdpD
MRSVALEEVVPAALHSLGGRATAVELSLPTALADVIADPALLERVVANLVSNAVEFSPPGESVRVTAGQGDDRVQLYVIDHGRGIRPKDRAVVLQPFHRLSDSTANSGVGLGLAIAQGLTVAMGGHLELRDTPGGGLTAVVTLLAGHRQPPEPAGLPT